LFDQHLGSLHIVVVLKYQLGYDRNESSLEFRLLGFIQSDEAFFVILSNEKRNDNRFDVFMLLISRFLESTSDLSILLIFFYL
jgi:hypothetical protein